MTGRLRLLRATASCALLLLAAGAASAETVLRLGHASSADSLVGLKLRTPPIPVILDTLESVRLSLKRSFNLSLTDSRPSTRKRGGTQEAGSTAAAARSTAAWIPCRWLQD